MGAEVAAPQAFAAAACDALAAAMPLRRLEALHHLGLPAAPPACLRFEPPAADAGVELRCRLWCGAESADGNDKLLAKVHRHAAATEWMSAAA